MIKKRKSITRFELTRNLQRVNVNTLVNINQGNAKVTCVRLQVTRVIGILIMQTPNEITIIIFHTLNVTRFAGSNNRNTSNDKHQTS